MTILPSSVPTKSADMVLKGSIKDVSEVRFAESLQPSIFKDITVIREIETSHIPIVTMKLNDDPPIDKSKIWSSHVQIDLSPLPKHVSNLLPSQEMHACLGIEECDGCIVNQPSVSTSVQRKIKGGRSVLKHLGFYP